MTQAQALARRLGTGDAVVIGLSSMIGAGVFSAFAPAAQAAGSAAPDRSRVGGGGRLLQRGGLGPARRAVSDLRRDVRLRPRAPRGMVGIHRRLGLRGRQDRLVRRDGAHLRVVRRRRLRMGRSPDRLRRGGRADGGQLPWDHRGRPRSRASSSASRSLALLVAVCAIAAHGGEGAGGDGFSSLGHGGVYGVLQAAGLLFFAFAGYARIATLGEEVRDPERTIPRAIPLALGITVGLYLARRRRAARRPGALRAGGQHPRRWPQRWTWSAPPGHSGRPGRRGRRQPRRAAGPDRGRRPHRPGDGPERRPAPLARLRPPDATACPTTPSSRSPRSSRCWSLTTDLRGAIGFSSFGVLIVLRDRERVGVHAGPGAPPLAARAERWSGLVGCAVLVVTLPWTAVVAGVGVFAAGLGGRLVLRGR